MSDSSLVPVGGGLDAHTAFGGIDSSDLTVPRLKILHKEGMFEDSLSNEQFATIDVITLGLVRQRVMWALDVEDDAKPLCKSRDFEFGTPGDDFPWDASKLSKADFSDGKLPCENCHLKEWDTHPRGKTPWCTEQHVYPLLMSVGEDAWSAAILTVQRTGMKPSKAYISSFVRAKRPLFTKFTRLSLEQNKRGSVFYSVPKFQVLGDTDPANHAEYGEQFLGIRHFLMTPRIEDDAVVVGSDDSEPEF